MALQRQGTKKRRTTVAATLATALTVGSWAVGSWVLGSCTPRAGEVARALIDAQHAPDLLFESRELAPPPSTTGNRTLEGWWPRPTERGLRLLPNPRGVSLEVTQIERRPRVLQLTFDREGLDPTAIGRPVEVQIAGGERREIALSNPLDIPLAADLPLGRVPVRLIFPEDAGVLLASASLDVAAEPGRIDVDGGRVRQSGTSLLDLTRPFPARSRLSGRFVPPESPRSGQSFELLVESADGAVETVLAWDGATTGVPAAIDHRFGTAGFRRIRLVARGDGPPATWEDLRILSEGVAETTADAPTADAPTAGADPATTRPRLVLFYVLDALRADGLGAYGGAPEVSPTIDRLAAEGVVFRDHQTVAPNTLPSTKALFSGRTPIRQGNAKLADGGLPTLAEELARGGYRTGLFSGNEYVSRLYGTARGFDFVDDTVVFEESRPGGGRYNDNAIKVHAAAVAWLDGLADDERAFLYLHTIHPHNPYDPPAELQPPLDGRSTIDGSSRTLLDIKHVRRPTSDADRERLTALYRASITFNDRELRRLLDEVLRRYDRSEILLVVTSDHGEELFDHRGVLHGYTLYEEQLDIPLIVWAPGHLAPATVSRPTTNAELGDALRRLALPAADGGPTFFDWVREAPVAGAPAVRFAAASSVQGGIFMARSDRYKVVWAPRQGTKWGMGEGTGRSRSIEYVFDLERDPEERRNLAGTGDLEVAWLRSRLLAWVAHEGEREEAGEEPVLDAEAEARLRALGYLD